MHKIFLSLSLLACFLALFTNEIQSQNSIIPPGEVLVYRRVSQEKTELIRLSSDNRQIYDVTLDRCAVVSPDGKYVAQSSNSAESLSVRLLSTQEERFHLVWNPAWQPCQFVFRDEFTSLMIFYKTEGLVALLDLHTGLITEPTHSPSTLRAYPNLPDQFDGSWIWPSPNRDIVLYERCTDLQTGSNGEYCAIDLEYVIYDTRHERVRHVLNDPISYLIHDYADPIANSLYAYGEPQWSSDGHYLAFQGHPKMMYRTFTLKIYDLENDQYLDTDWFNIQMDTFRKIQWSPQVNRLAFWMIGRLPEPQPEDDLTTLRSLILFDKSTGVFLAADQAFNINTTGVWSLSGAGYAFVDINHSLIYVDAVTGQSVFLDRDVDSIIGWNNDLNQLVND